MSREFKNCNISSQVAEGIIGKNKYPFDVPLNWVWMKAGSLGKVSGGGTPKKGASSCCSSGTIPWITLKDMADNKSINISEGKRKISFEEAKENFIRIVPKDTILLSSRAPIGYVAIAENELCTNQGIKNFEPSVWYIPRYAYWYFKSAGPLLMEYANGTTIPEISVRRAAEIPFALPPLAEQQRIADKVESIMSQMEKANELMKLVPKIVVDIKNTVLKEAFTDEFKNISKRKPSVYQIGDLCTVIRGKSPRPAGDSRYFGGDVPWITINEITKDENEHIDSVSSFLTEAGRLRSRFVEKDTLLLSISGTTLGVPKITEISGCINDGIVAFTNLDDNLKLYLYYFLKWKSQEMKEINRGALQSNLNTDIIKSFSLEIPSRDKMSAVVRQLRNIFCILNELQDRYNNLKKELGNIERRIFSLAFSGRLGTNKLEEKNYINYLSDDIK